jgi:diadenylate cyclase
LPISTRLILDVFDVLIVTILFYRVLVLVRGTRAAQMVLGLALLAILSVVAELFNLPSLKWLFESLRTVWVIGFLILFQPELRRGLTQLGQTRLFKGFLRVSESASLGELQRGVESMCVKGLGGIIVIERNVGLTSYVETGTKLEAQVTAELLETIFTPPSPLHDGAVVIRGNQVVAAGCILPLSQNPLLERTHGTRHRAAVGLSEESDAIAIAISEETSQVSVAEHGILHRLKSPADLRSYLASLLQEEGPSEEAPAAQTGEPIASRESSSS